MSYYDPASIIMEFQHQQAALLVRILTLEKEKADLEARLSECNKAVPRTGSYPLGFKDDGF